MGEQTTLILTAIGAIMTGLGLPKLYGALVERKRIEEDSDCKQKILALQLEMNQLKTGVDMLLTIIEDEFEDKENYKNVIDKVKVLLQKTGSNEMK